MSPSEHEFSQVCDLLAELVRARSTNPPGDERQPATVIEHAARRLGLPPPQHHACRPERPNLLIEIGHGDPHLLLAAHMDTMPTGPVALWDTEDPFELEQRDGRLVGLGCADMKAAIASMLHAAARIVQHPPPSGTLTLAFTADEESGSAQGMAWLCANGLIKADAAVMTEPSSITATSWDALYVAQRGSCVARLVATGQPGHSGERLDPRQRAGTAFAHALSALVDAELFADFRHEVDGSLPTVNIATMVSGGETPFAHPAELEAIVEVRTIAGMSERQVLDGLRAALAPLGLNGRIRVEPGPAPGWIPGGETVVDARLLGAARTAWRGVLGTPAREAVLPAGTDSSFMNALGIPALPAFGPGTLAVAHRPNESIRAADLPIAIDLFESLARNYFTEVSR